MFFSLVYFEDLNIYTFSLAIFYPQLDENLNGRMPLYVKLFPRGNLADQTADISSLELLTVC